MKGHSGHSKHAPMRRRAWAAFAVAIFMLASQADGVDATTGAVSGQAAVTEALGHIQSYQGCPVIVGSFSYRGAGSSFDTRERFYYSDGYFRESATVYDEHLASMSMCLAGAAMASYEGKSIAYQNKSANARELLDRIGCTDICVNTDFVSKPGEDTIGVVLGRKEITLDGQVYTLIPIGIRGAGYEKEWLGNMKVGSEGDAAGFRTAADRAKTTVENYIKEYAIDPAKTKFWIAGFSRAGAVTDLLTKELTDAYDPTGANIYGYSFATPQAAYQKTRSYPNSHCTINREDSVPMVVPSYMGFGHYGDEVILDDPGNSFPSYVVQVQYAMEWPVTVPNGIEFVDSTRFTSQSDYLQQLIGSLQATVAPDRKAFSETRIEEGETLEEILSQLLKFMMTSSSEHISEVASSVAGFQKYLGVKGLFRLDDMIDAVKEGIATKTKEERDELYAALWKWFGPGLEQTLTQEEYQSVGSMWKSLVYIIFEVAHYDYVHSGKDGFALIGTLMKNMQQIGQAHTPEKYFNLIKSKDNYYQNQSGSTPAGKLEETFRIGEAADVDAVVYQGGQPVAVFRQGRTVAAKEETAYICRVSDAGSDLKPNAAENLYRNPDPDTERSIAVTPDTTYEVELIAGQRWGDVEFQKWIDESGREVSSSPSYTVIVDHGKTTHQMLRPVYRTIPKETEAPPSEPGSREGGGSGIWLYSLLGVLAVGGGVGGGVYARKRHKKKQIAKGKKM
ncbi:MAG: hypothetical protein VZQ83_03810 [Eubacterium sp.]|nr:hypothetical protein [Eubacterium sp.]